jgi:hypothetical protein
MRKILIAMCVLLAGCEKARLDEQVRELCAKDGGIKVYEMVKLPPDKFNKYGQINFYRPNEYENALGNDYIWKSQVVYIKNGNPVLGRFFDQVIRRSDSKILGESVAYFRIGGDMHGPWNESSFSCPDGAGDVSLLGKVFVSIN